MKKYHIGTGTAITNRPSHITRQNNKGQTLRYPHEIVKPMGITQRELSDSIHVPYQRINEIINQKRGMTPSTALRLSKYFGVSEDFWLNLQLRLDLFKVRQKETRELKKIHPYKSNLQSAANI